MPARVQELRPQRKLRCEAQQITHRRVVERTGLRAQCTTNGEPLDGHVMCWVHRKRWEAGKPVEFVASAQTLNLLFPHSEITL